MNPDCTFGRQAMLDRRREVVQVGLVTLRSLLELDVLRDDAFDEPGVRTLHRLYRPPSPSPDVRRRFPSSPTDMMLLNGRTASGCRSGRRRSAVRFGRSLQVSCANDAEDLVAALERGRTELSYLPVPPSRTAGLVTGATRPVSTA